MSKKIDFKTCKMYYDNEWVIIGTQNRFDSLFALIQSNDFATFKDIINGKDKYGWVNSNGEPIGGLHGLTGGFKNDFARFYDKINGKDKWGWVNRNGEPIGGLHDGADNFVNNFATFRDKINGENKLGCIDKYGIEYKMYLDNARKTQGLILKEFPVGSIKFYIFWRMYEN